MRRHPHVFGDVAADDADTVMANWDDIKRVEKERTSVFDGVAAVAAGARLRPAPDQRKAAKVGFDWPDVVGPLAKVDEELAELRGPVGAGDAGDIADELGDVVIAARQRRPAHPASTPSWPARRGGKFRRRFEAVEQLAAERGLDVPCAVAADELDALWDEVKAPQPVSGRLAGRAAAARRPGGPPPRRDAAVRRRSR